MAGLSVGDVVSECRLNHYLFNVDLEGLGVYDRLEQGDCIAWALFGNEFSIVVVGLDMVLFIWQE